MALQDTKVAASKSDDGPRAGASKPALCNHPSGCPRPAAAVRSDTRKGAEGWCRLHRKNAQQAAWKKDQKKPAKPAAKKPAPAKKPQAKAAPARRAAAPVMDHAAAVELVTRALVVIGRLGGIDKAEQLATLVGGA